MTRLYKVFLVEDEIVARERIRDNIDWTAAGFEFSGEAPDGEIALPKIQAARPDLLITDMQRALTSVKKQIGWRVKTV